jgi:hypothetical protein
LAISGKEEKVCEQFAFAVSSCQTFDAVSIPEEEARELAQKVNIVLVDDVDGSEASETVSFGLDGTSYEIDLNDKNAAKLRDALSGFVGHARKVGAARRGRRSSAPSGGPSPREIREWARSQGMDVPDRGRVSADVRAAYEKAH